VYICQSCPCFLYYISPFFEFYECERWCLSLFLYLKLSLFFALLCACILSLPTTIYLFHCLHVLHFNSFLHYMGFFKLWTSSSYTTIINSRVSGSKRAKLTFFWHDNLVIGLKKILVVLLSELIRVNNTSDQSSNFHEMAVTCLVEDVVFCKRSHFNWLQEKGRIPLPCYFLGFCEPHLNHLISRHWFSRCSNWDFLMHIPHK
jgi:hypothetical protein